VVGAWTHDGRIVGKIDRAYPESWGSSTDQTNMVYFASVVVIISPVEPPPFATLAPDDELLNKEFLNVELDFHAAPTQK
jgi:hypothetical protein